MLPPFRDISIRLPYHYCVTCFKVIYAYHRALYSTILHTAVFCFLLFFTGFVAYAYFSDCDPLLAGKISAADQIVPYMVLQVFADLPGLPGFFIAGVFAAALR